MAKGEEAATRKSDRCRTRVIIVADANSCRSYYAIMLEQSVCVSSTDSAYNCFVDLHGILWLCALYGDMKVFDDENEPWRGNNREFIES